jgi:signal transduction histidine kinase
MSQQRYEPVFSIASPVEIEQTVHQLEAIRDEFLTHGDLKQRTPRRLILESWYRCRQMQVDADRQQTAFPILKQDQLVELREVDESLIRAVQPVLVRLAHIMGEVGYVVALANAGGWLLEVIGNVALRRKLAQAGLIPGSNWSEVAAGTNGLGTALATGHVTQIMAGEHYCGGWRDISCTAAPIRHPLSGEILGALDLTGDYWLTRPFLPGFLVTATLEIEQGLRAILTAHPDQNHQPSSQFGNRYIPKYLISSETAHMKNNPPAIPPQGIASPKRIAKDRLFSHLHFKERRARNAERLAAATGMISASLDLTATIEQVARQMAHILELDCAAVCLFDENGAIATSHVWSKNRYLLPQRELILKMLLHSGEDIGLIRERGEPVLYNDLLASGQLSPLDATQADIRAIALLPLAAPREVIGFVAAPRGLSVEWTADEVRLGLTLATHAATALENARLFATLQQHNQYVEALNELSRFLQILPDPIQCLDSVLRQIVSIMGLDIGLIVCLDGDSANPAVVAYFGLTALNVEELGARFDKLSHEIIFSHQAVSICLRREGEADQAQLLRVLGCCDLIAAPLMTDGTVVNILLVGSYNHHCLGDEQLRLFRSMAHQLALTLKNAQLLRSTSEIAALREADRLKSEFLAAISHDLRSPLTAIHTSLESMLETNAASPLPEQQYLLHHVNGQVSRLSRLVDQLLDLSRLEAGAFPLDRDWVDLAAVMEDVIAKFDLFYSHYPVERRLAANLPLQYVDAASISQVVWNLLENTAKYAPPDMPIRVEACWTGQEVLIRVADRGKSIPASEREKIFQHFYRLKQHQQPHTPGSGLGLAICRGIVEAHGGRIWAEAGGDGGNVFCIALPPAAADSADFEELVTREFQASSTPTD